MLYELRMKYKNGEDYKAKLMATDRDRAIMESIVHMDGSINLWDDEDEKPVSVELYETGYDFKVKCVHEFKPEREYLQQFYIMMAWKASEQARAYLEHAVNVCKRTDGEDVLKKCMDAAGIKLAGAITDLDDFLGLSKIKWLWKD